MSAPVWLLERTAEAVERSATVEEAASAALTEIASATGWSGGALFPSLVDGGRRRWADGLAEQVLTSGQAATAPQEPGGPVTVAVPIRVRGTVVAVLEVDTGLGAEEAVATVAVLVEIGRQLGWVGERALLSTELARQVDHRARHDLLTSLPNRALLHERVDAALANPDRRAGQGGNVALVCLDVDRFTVINDSLGVPVGDRLLQALSERLKAVLRPGDTLARIGADEYALLLHGVGSRQGAADQAERVTAALATPFDVDGREVPVTACLGVALAAAASTAEQLLREAEIALGRAKSRGVGQSEVFDDAMRGARVDRLAVEGDLRTAIRQAQLRLAYQPIVDLVSGALEGAEALIRWQHPTRGLLLPAQFIALAEESGLIVPLGAWVLEEAVSQLTAWRTAGEPPLRVSVNVSAHQFRRDGWMADVAALLVDAGLAPGQLVFEITESVLMDDTEATLQRLGRLRDLGVRVAIDDFGTGYSSLGYLRQFPVDILKVDRRFIEGVASGPHESALARAVIKLATTLNLEAVAEGVGDRDQYDALRRLNCPLGQGYFFARPQPPEAIIELAALPSLVGAGVGADTSRM